MNREIKFRAWDKLQNKMINAEPFSEEIAIQLGGVMGLFNGKTYDTVTDEFILMQYTGLKDKNGKEIYEGDILKYTAHDGYGLFPGRLTIKWIDDSACFGYSHSDQSFSPGYVSPFTEHDELQHDILNYSEVIGNIYENPELLKTK